MNTIEAINLNRSFNGRKAVLDVSFPVEEGEIFGLLGPNGAGKTTTIRMLTGQLRPTAGEARVAGCDVVRERQALKSQIGVVFEYQNLYERMTGGENLLFAARLYGCGPLQVREMMEKVGLADRAKDPIRSYSNGMKQRLLIARALLHRPRILFLDEPTKGLDPTASRQIRDLVMGLAALGVTILLTTHYMEEADQLCRRVAFLNEGRIVAMDTPQKLKLSHGERLVRTVFKDGSDRTVSLDNPADGRQLGEWAARGDILTVHSAEATLEQIFIRLTGKGLDE
ncbi:MAG: ABC transporter ATP-binding protein [Anaerolineales bacterium]|nr:ABC transporter ATP-binding protein [Anaerolineales bacterium]